MSWCGEPWGSWVWGDACTAQCGKAVSRLPQQFKASEALRRLLCLYAKQVQHLVDAAADVRDLRFALSTAEGVHLDRLGGNLGLLRNGLTDDEYALLLAARVLASNEGDHPDDMLELVRAVFATETLALSEEYPAAFTIEIDEPIANANIGILTAQLLHEARPAGVHSILYFHDTAEAALFAISSTPDTPETDSATGFGTTSDPDIGGELMFAR